jgi:hypothetical protein
VQTGTGFNLSGVGATAAGGFGTVHVGDFAVDGFNLPAAVSRLFHVQGVLTLNTGGSFVFGGTHTFKGADIVVDGSFSVGTVGLEASNSLENNAGVTGINIDAAGRLSLVADSSASGSVKLQATNNIVIVAGTVDITGGSGVGAFAQIDPALVKLDVDGALTITSGDGAGSSAGIVGDDIEIFAGELSLFAGAGGQASASIQATAGDLTVEFVTVELGVGLGLDSHTFMSATETFELTFEICESCIELFQDPSVTPATGLFGNPLELIDFRLGASSGADIADLLLTNTDDDDSLDEDDDENEDGEFAADAGDDDGDGELEDSKRGLCS